MRSFILRSHHRYSPGFRFRLWPDHWIIIIPVSDRLVDIWILAKHMIMKTQNQNPVFSQKTLSYRLTLSPPWLNAGDRIMLSTWCPSNMELEILSSNSILVSNRRQNFTQHCLRVIQVTFGNLLMCCNMNWSSIQHTPPTVRPHINRCAPYE